MKKERKGLERALKELCGAMRACSALNGNAAQAAAAAAVRTVCPFLIWYRSFGNEDSEHCSSHSPQFPRFSVHIQGAN